MKRIAEDEKSITFHLSAKERRVLEDVLRSYPVVPAGHLRASKTLEAEKAAEVQTLLDEALAEERARSQKLVEEWLQAPERFTPVKRTLHLVVARADVEWLLQVLNDVRVGFWIQLGSPESMGLTPPSLQPVKVRAWFLATVAASLQMLLIGEEG